MTGRPESGIEDCCDTPPACPPSASRDDRRCGMPAPRLLPPVPVPAGRSVCGGYGCRHKRLIGRPAPHPPPLPPRGRQVIRPRYPTCAVRDKSAPFLPISPHPPSPPPVAYAVTCRPLQDVRPGALIREPEVCVGGGRWADGAQAAGPEKANRPCTGMARSGQAHIRPPLRRRAARDPAGPPGWGGGGGGRCGLGPIPVTPGPDPGRFQAWIALKTAT